MALEFCYAFYHPRCACLPACCSRVPLQSLSSSRGAPGPAASHEFVKEATFYLSRWLCRHYSPGGRQLGCATVPPPGAGDSSRLPCPARSHQRPVGCDCNCTKGKSACSREKAVAGFLVLFVVTPTVVVCLPCFMATLWLVLAHLSVLPRSCGGASLPLSSSHLVHQQTYYSLSSTSKSFMRRPGPKMSL